MQQREHWKEDARGASLLRQAMPIASWPGYPKELATAFSTRVVELERSIGEFAFEQYLVETDRFMTDLLPGLLPYLTEPQAQLLLLEISNLLVLKFEYRHRHELLIAHPIGSQIDPSNACTLRCPACAHTGNPAANVFIWPAGTLRNETLSAYLDEHGPFMFDVYFANYGEPLLNKRVSELVRLARQFYMPTYSSSSLSVPKIDYDALIDSGLSFLIVSIDGISQDVYEKYRKSGDLALALHHLRNLVLAKKRKNSYTPVVHCQFLLFEHNKHEEAEAIDLAREIGVNEIRVARPYRVDWDDPAVMPAAEQPIGTVIIEHDNQRMRDAFDAAADDLNEDTIGRHFAISWLDRWRGKGSPGGNAAIFPEHAPGCEWLYKSASLDATGRVMPCARPPATDANLVFAVQGRSDIFNGPMHRLARRYFSDRAGYARDVASLPARDIPYCSRCEHPNTKLDIDTREIVANHLRNGALYRVVNTQARDLLTNW